tara:strand:+ start:2801 stop:2977 length:177 start_codon:yes stop_codon:yes gene_type:complete
MKNDSYTFSIQPNDLKEFDKELWTRMIAQRVAMVMDKYFEGKQTEALKVSVTTEALDG